MEKQDDNNVTNLTLVTSLISEVERINLSRAGVMQIGPQAFGFGGDQIQSSKKGEY